MLDRLLDQLNGCSHEPSKHFGIRIHLQVSLSKPRGVGVGTAALQHCSTADCSLPNITLSDSDALWPRRELCTQLNISALVYRLGTG